MEIVAQARGVRISPRKIRLMADTVRRLPLSRALEVLTVTGKRASLALEKTLRSAIANASHNKNLSLDQLQIKLIEVTEGEALKRFHPSSRGRVHPYKRRSSHVKIVLEEKKGANV